MKKTIAKLLLTTLALPSVKMCPAQEVVRYTDAASLLVIGKAKRTDSLYHRIDSGETKEMPDVVKGLAKRSAGIAILFETNSTFIRAKWQLTGEVYLPNMTPIAHSGLDLYCLKKGKWQFVGVGRPAKGSDQDQMIIQNMDSSLKQFMLYLPLYNSISNLQIGIQKQAEIKAPVRTIR